MSDDFPFEVVQQSWRPGAEPTMNSSAMCQISRCRYELTEAWTSKDPHCATPTGLKDIPDFSKPRLIIWYQEHCMACQNSKIRVFPSVRKVAEERGFTVHEVELTKELLQRFPHVTMVPYYDLITPVADPQACSSYGPRTQVRSLRNDLQQITQEFPNFVLLPAPPTPMAKQ